MADKKRTEIAELGEFGLIEHLTKNFKIKNESTKTAIGDDSAVLDYDNKQTLVSTDLLLEGIHFDLTYTPLKHLGYKAVAINLSDIYAMNAQPEQITVSIGVSSKMSVESLDEFYAGVHLACDKYGVDLAGGDTSASLTGFTISITALGTADPEKITYRSGAAPNDIICASGDFGAAYMGLQLLEREKKVFSTNPEVQPDLAGYDYLLERILKPEPRKDVIDLLNKLDVKPTSMIDVSDGISSDILHICKSSGVGCRIHEDKIPIDLKTSMLAEEMGINPIVAALNGGEDYEMLFTISQQDYDKFINANGGVNIYAIGYITEESKGYYLVTEAGQEIKLSAQGWKHI
ncbi:MAG: thiamine-phosphate kinase [Chlorobi bacterium]|nr:thiamine-phosphate kinase [Chlorobiota bacterium]